MNNETRAMRGTQGKKQFSQRKFPPRIDVAMTIEEKTNPIASEYQPYKNLKFSNEMPKVPKYSENEIMIKQRYHILNQIRTKIGGKTPQYALFQDRKSEPRKSHKLLKQLIDAQQQKRPPSKQTKLEKIYNNNAAFSYQDLKRPQTGKNIDSKPRIVKLQQQPILVIKNVNLTSRNQKIQNLNTFNHPSKKNSKENINEYLQQQPIRLQSSSSKDNSLSIDTRHHPQQQYQSNKFQNSNRKLVSSKTSLGCLAQSKKFIKIRKVVNPIQNSVLKIITEEQKPQSQFSNLKSELKIDPKITIKIDQEIKQFDTFGKIRNTGSDYKDPENEKLSESEKQYTYNDEISFGKKITDSSAFRAISLEDKIEDLYSSSKSSIKLSGPSFKEMTNPSFNFREEMPKGLTQSVAIPTFSGLNEERHKMLISEINTKMQKMKVKLMPNLSPKMYEESNNQYHSIQIENSEEPTENYETTIKNESIIENSSATEQFSEIFIKPNVVLRNNIAKFLETKDQHLIPKIIKTDNKIDYQKCDSKYFMEIMGSLHSRLIQKEQLEELPNQPQIVQARNVVNDIITQKMTLLEYKFLESDSCYSSSSSSCELSQKLGREILQVTKYRQELREKQIQKIKLRRKNKMSEEVV